MLYEFIFLLIVLILYFRIESFFRKKMKLPKEEDILYKHFNKIHKWGELIIIIISLTILFLIGFVFSNELKSHYFIVGLITVNVFRAFMEWKFKRETQQLILTSITICALLVMFIGIELFFY